MPSSYSENTFRYYIASMRGCLDCSVYRLNIKKGHMLILLKLIWTSLVSLNANLSFPRCWKLLVLFTMAVKMLLLSLTSQNVAMYHILQCIQASYSAVSQFLDDLLLVDSCPFESCCSIQRPCPTACSAWMFLWWTIQLVRGPILAWSHAGWCAPDTWMEAETRAMWIITCFFFFIVAAFFATFSMKCRLSLHNPISLCWSGWLRQPPGVLWRGPWPGVMGSRMCGGRLPRGLRQGVWVPLLDRRRPQSKLLKKFPVFHLLPASVFHHLHPQRQPLVYLLSGVLDKHTSQNVDNKINTSWVQPHFSSFLFVFSFFWKEDNKSAWQNNIQKVQSFSYIFV